ncbi:alpha/beta hydrolase (plasmid) [Streptomyces sp. NBC_01340]|uniref:alpha/beta fold hydrolase n=1 Tax=unclassified Streptomyces TaxID=2593676 RepID=UPI0022512572|nr:MULTISPECIES: alpha/beta hydrolase [unclassified Streptomyces]MCX4460806.1 alpha/beta hydrolase [Streptomyces sp. NBC_01719]MCX4499864.1 alpha/beta hydrolase [Streptomyces sp. NBC_01728]WSI44993.1 alpha/beta hydrolase [Streptomyces sp. NBC_01340]
MKKTHLTALVGGAVAATTLAAALAGAPAFATSTAHAPGSPQHSRTVDAKVPAGFTEHKVKVGKVGIDYVEGGHGPTLVLLHGYPQSWYEWHKVMPELSKHYHVIAPSLRGAGNSDAPASGYDKKTMAEDVHGLLKKLGRDRDINLVGHDIGTMVAYAYAAAHPHSVSKLVLSEAPLPDKSLYKFPSLTAQGPGFWNFGFFNVTNGLPERTIKGHETEWVERFSDMLEYNKDGVSLQDAAVYGHYLKDPAHLKASFEWFRTLNKDVADNAEYSKTKLQMPVLALGAQYSLGRIVPDQVSQYGTNVTGAVVPNSGHWMWEENPAEMTARLLNFLGR